MGTPPRYIYTSLPSQCIRVLELHPGLSDAPLECDVVVQQIDGKRYEALSYVWGDAAGLPFSPNNLLFLLSSNLMLRSLSPSSNAQMK
jgi:hypothetical protein